MTSAQNLQAQKYSSSRAQSVRPTVRIPRSPRSTEWTGRLARSSGRRGRRFKSCHPDSVDQGSDQRKRGRGLVVGNARGHNSGTTWRPLSDSVSYARAALGSRRRSPRSNTRFRLTGHHAARRIPIVTKPALPQPRLGAAPRRCCTPPTKGAHPPSMVWLEADPVDAAAQLPARRGE